MTKKSLHSIRREYGQRSLDENTALSDPIKQFQQWLDDAIQADAIDPTAMVLATVDEHGMPDTRILLLKDIIDDRFVFYTNYESTKGQQIARNNQVSLNFYWPVLSRQIRIRGFATKIAEELSDNYFAARPCDSQLSAIVSPQSHVISSREALQTDIEDLKESCQGQPVLRPSNWGGYQVEPKQIEFWQGRDNRLHDRLRYTRENSGWKIERLAP